MASEIEGAVLAVMSESLKPKEVHKLMIEKIRSLCVRFRDIEVVNKKAMIVLNDPKYLEIRLISEGLDKVIEFLGEKFDELSIELNDRVGLLESPEVKEMFGTDFLLNKLELNYIGNQIRVAEEQEREYHRMNFKDLVERRPSNELEKDIRGEASHALLHLVQDGRSSDEIQRLELVQQQIERKELPGGHTFYEYSTITSCFMYSAIVGSVTKLEKVSSYPAKWRHAFYYAPMGPSIAIEIMTSCVSKQIVGLADVPIDPVRLAITV
ncbi:MAG: hypothetical protein Hyperionvirus4_93 [Hyperionvirus sp.]|uniref:Uncharacterized protein n=1 Tax=Hyperionvirus sp. TaxID=2487770 RepID=A0A3G5A7H7_9VIRU|nr:MAG: hypothetical protein Hyperionvirus4_93 [Hyperionvirus sp.]